MPPRRSTSIFLSVTFTRAVESENCLTSPNTRSSSASESEDWRPRMVMCIDILYHLGLIRGISDMINSDMTDKKPNRPSFRFWLTLVTLMLLAVVVFAAWPEIVKAWGLLDRVDLWVLSLIVPVQLFSYYATGAMIFSYLRKKGNIKDVSRWRMSRMALELNFVNHILPSGGAAGFSYLAWILRRYDVPVSRSTMAQVIRFTLTFVSFVMLLIISILVLAVSHHVDRFIVGVGVGMTLLVVVAMALILWLFQSRKRLDRFSNWIERLLNRVVQFFTRDKRRKAIKSHALVEFFDGMHDDYVQIRRDRKILVRPYIWATIANMLDAALLWVAFASLGFPVDPALLFIAFGVSSLLSAISVTPGGAGVYETVMVMFLTASGISADVAIAGTLLARVTLVLGTILFGYVFYQMTIIQHGKAPVKLKDE